MDASKMAQAAEGLPRVVISANGIDTQTKRLRQLSASKDIVTSSSLDGVNAAPALDGGIGKRVKIELFRSRRGGFVVKGKIGNTLSTTHVEKGFDLFVSSRGSNGEDGGKGGDGKQGQQGYDGLGATQHSDAKPGRNGGQGGDGGLGSSGGNGGDGGKVIILTSERNMHLLVAVDWNMKGGKGGRAGEHGQPGRGGIGGKGGSGYSWKEITDHQWKCVDHGSMALTSPIGRGLAPLTSANLAHLGQLRPGRDLAFSFPQGGYISDGTHVAQLGNLQGTIPANMAPHFRRALLGSGNVLTRGGQSATTAGHAPGCLLEPIYTTRRKPGASNGNKGSPGRTPTAVLTSGRDGLDGTAAIQVRNDDGTVSTYNSRFEFQLVDFEVEDENDDSIFEPGECVIIKNIRIKNIGGMPTPKRTKIPLRMQPSSWLAPVSGKDVIFLPFNIPPGETKRTTHEIWAQIKSPHTQPDSTPVQAVSTIKLEATIPDLDRRVPHFEYSQNITIQYPVKLVSDEFKWMDTIPQGSSTSLQWVVLNISSKDLGCNSQSQRNIVTKISCTSTSPAILGDRLSTSLESEHTSRRHELNLQRDMSSHVSESLFIPKDTPEYSTIDFLIELLLTPTPTQKLRRSLDLTTIQTFRLSMQVSKTWQYNSSSKFLLLTSKSTTKDTVDSWCEFIREHLKMSVDVWNVSLYGGLEAEATGKSVLDSYVGKTILALDDDLFQYFDRGQRSILDFIDPSEGSALSRKGTRVMSVQRKAESRHGREGNNIEHLAQAAVLKTPRLTANELHQLENTDELITRLRQLRENPSSSVQNEQYFIPFHGSSLNGKGKKIVKKLKKEFPLENFIVTDSADGLGVRITYCGAHGQGYSTAQVAQTSNGVGRIEEFSGLNPAEAYSCVSALPLKARLDLLLASQEGTGKFAYSEFIQNAALSSVKIELYNQVQAMAKHPRWRDGLFSGPEKISTKCLSDSASDKITTVLEHGIMLNAALSVDDLSSPAGQILRSIIQSAQCQNTQQLLMKWFSPFKRTRSHVRQSLMKHVLEVIASSAQNQTNDPNPRAPDQRIQTFKKTVTQRLRHKNYQTDINNNVQTITHNAIRDVKQSLTSIEEVMPKSVYKSPGELMTKAKSYKEAEIQRKRDTIQHREWKQELGLEITEQCSIRNDNAELEASDFSEFTSISGYDQSMVSNISAASTILTLHELKDSSPSKIKESQWKVGGVESLPVMDEKPPPRPRIEEAHEMQSNFSGPKSLPLEMDEKSPSWFESHDLQWNIGEIDSLPEMGNKQPPEIQKPHELHSAISEPKSLPEMNDTVEFLSEMEKAHTFHWETSEIESPLTPSSQVNIAHAWKTSEEKSWPLTPSSPPLSPSLENVGEAWKRGSPQSPVTPSPFNFPPPGENFGADGLVEEGEGGRDLLFGCRENVQGRTSLEAGKGIKGLDGRNLGPGDEDLGTGPVWFDYDEEELRFS